MIWTRKCRKCGQLYDIDVSKDLCPECRTGFKINGGKGDGQRKL